jgi:hypothetical protein
MKGHDDREVRLRCGGEPEELPQEMVQLCPFVYIVMNL